MTREVKVSTSDFLTINRLYNCYSSHNFNQMNATKTSLDIKTVVVQDVEEALAAMVYMVIKTYITYRFVKKKIVY